MVLTGQQKAAMLLMSLDAPTASELIKGLDAEVVQALAVEAAYLDAAGYRNSRQCFELAKQFVFSLQKQRSQPQKKAEFEINGFLGQMLKSSVGEQKAEQIQQQLTHLVQKRDPFLAIKQSETKFLVSILEKEHPQAIAVVLSEMPTKKSSEILSFLHESIRVSAVRRLVASGAIAPQAKQRIAEMVCDHIEQAKAPASTAAAATAAPTRPEARSAEGGLAAAKPEPTEALRKAAVILRNLAKELRDGLLVAIREKDSQTAQAVADLMVIWEDVPLVAERPLQNALRGIDAKFLALALFKTDQIVVAKIKSAISERAVAALDEETSFLKAPKQEDITAARDKIITALRQLDEKGELSFIE
jgi:flagellar motor switch protein FliG